MVTTELRGDFVLRYEECIIMTCLKRSWTFDQSKNHTKKNVWVRFQIESILKMYTN